MSAQQDLSQLRRENSLESRSASRDQLIAYIGALEDLYRAHPAQRVLEELHRYLFPERYGAIALYEWHAGTITDVANRIDRALPDAPGAHALSRERLVELLTRELDAELLDWLLVEQRGVQRSYIVLWRRRRVGDYGTHRAVITDDDALLIWGKYDLDLPAARTDFQRRTSGR